ncbi:hypothetical protein [Cellulomonas soli]|uniref:hypothetical protein n=1 Tax=Cellulomonas soli TaxID=931535 RepID=UPI0016622D96|nr:hypothetical protein [Cellulomonas soli]NYI59155.1 hypothetical protein [Cellulomonas soli]
MTRSRRCLAIVVAVCALVVGGLASPASAVVYLPDGYVQICAPKKCVIIPESQYCPPTKASCVNGKWSPVTGYCSPSVGCVTIDGKNYRWIGSGLEAVNNVSAHKCAAGLGVSIIGLYTGPLGVAILGAAVSIWGCG